MIPGPCCCSSAVFSSVATPAQRLREALLGCVWDCHDEGVVLPAVRAVAGQAHHEASRAGSGHVPQTSAGEIAGLRVKCSVFRMYSCRQRVDAYRMVRRPSAEVTVPTKVGPAGDLQELTVVRFVWVVTAVAVLALESWLSDVLWAVGVEHVAPLPRDRAIVATEAHPLLSCQGALLISLAVWPQQLAGCIAGYMTDR